MFDKHFEVILADTDAARRIHYQLRYQVYCREEGFEPVSNFPDGAERDEWDEQSVHFIVRARQSREWVAAMRMILPQHNGLPVENQCSLDPSVRPLVADGNTAEISRMCIKGSYRRHGHVRRDASGDLPARSEIMLGLLRAAAAYSRENDILNWYFLTTPALARMINFLNVQLIKVGDACKHRGVRYPFLANIRQAEHQAKRGCPTIAAMLSCRYAYQRFSELHQFHEQPAARSLVA